MTEPSGHVCVAGGGGGGGGGGAGTLQPLRKATSIAATRNRRVDERTILLPPKQIRHT